MDKSLILLWFLPPDRPSGDRFRIGIEYHFRPVIAVTLLRFIDSVKSISVLNSIRIQPVYQHCINISYTEILRKRNFCKRLLLTVMIQYQSAARSFIRKDAEIDAAIHNGRPKRKDLAGAILKISKLMGRKCVYSLHIVSPYAGFYYSFRISSPYARTRTHSPP